MSKLFDDVWCSGIEYAGCVMNLEQYRAVSKHELDVDESDRHTVDSGKDRRTSSSRSSRETLYINAFYKYHRLNTKQLIYQFFEFTLRKLNCLDNICDYVPRWNTTSGVQGRDCLARKGDRVSK